MKRDTAQTIFRTVVVASAMLGASACSKKQAATTPQPVPVQPTADPTADPAVSDGTTTPDGDDGAYVDPCAGDEDGDVRPRGADDDGGGGAGRGFILS